MLLSSIKDFFKTRKKELFFVFLVFLLGFGIRAHLMKYDLFFEFDSYYHGRMVEFYLQNGHIPKVDPMAYYQLPEGGSLKPNVGEFFWLVTGNLFKLFTLNAPYNKENWIVAIKFFPAFFGALISVAMYYLGKELYDKKAGIIFAIFAATIPAFVYRTMSGFFEDDSLGFLPLVIGMVFLARALKNAEFNKSTIINSILAGLSLGLMALTWQGFGFAWMIFPPFFIATLVYMKLAKEPKEKIVNFSKNFVIFFLIMSTIATSYLGLWWFEFGLNQVIGYLPITAEGYSRLSTGSDLGPSVFSISIGEESQGIKYWLNKYNALVFFPFLAIAIFAIWFIYSIFSFYFKTEKEKKHSIMPYERVTLLIFFWILISMTMAFLKLKYTYVFGLPIAASAGFVAFEFFRWVGEKPSNEKKIVGLSFAFMLVTGIAAGSFFVTENRPNIEDDSGWKETLYWLKENTPKDSKILNWWNQGHWISFIAERKVSLDNRNYSLPENSLVAQFLLSDNDQNALTILSHFNSDYVVVSEDMISALPSLALYAYNKTNSNDPLIVKYGNSGIVNCRKEIDKLSKKKTYYCGNLGITEEQYLKFPTKRINEPNAALSQTSRGFVYRNQEETKLYIFSKASHDTLIARMFISPETIPWLEEVYTNNEVKVFKVMK
ncbi:MAG: STT3 domain-containing protein [Candidatus Diapherotrites archaeon]